MAGSNGSPAQRGGTPPHWPAESEEQARALELERWRHQQAQLAQQGYPQSHPQQGYQQPSPDYGQPSPFDTDPFGHQPQQGGYGQPHFPESNAPQNRNPFEPPYADAAPRPQGQFEPHFERFAPVPHAQDYPAPFDPHQLPAGGYDHVQDPFNPRRAQPQFDMPQGFDPNQGYGAPPGHASQGHRQDAHSGHFDGRGDPQSWDLSNYHPGQIPQGYQNQPALHDPHAQPEWGSPAPGAHDQQWDRAPGHEHWGSEGLHPQGQHYDPNAPAQYQQHYQLDPGYEHDNPNHDAGLESDEYDMPEEPRRGPSVVLVIGMLIGAIVVGGGLAFAYKHLGGGGHSAKIAEIKRQTTPEKVRPQDPGGKTIEHSDSAFLNRASVASSESRQSDVDGSAKKVSTIPIVVNRDGSLTPQSSNDSVAPSDTSGVPGLVLDGFGPPPVPPRLRPGVGQGPTEAPPQTQASRLPPPPPPVVRTPPRVADLPLPKVTNAPPPVTAAVERPAPPPPVRKPRVAERDDVVAHRTAASGVGAAGIEAPRRTPTHAVSKSGFVAVLASKRSRQEALNTFADLHSQYPEILGSVTPDVREANLGDKGTWYRLIGGPPGSREAARSICVKLKARGMKDCWPVAY